MEASDLKALADRQPAMTALDQRFYRDADIYEAEIERIFMNCWLYAGHVSEIPESGDWFLYELDRESVIVVRAADDRVNALANVCRHRGSRVCTRQRGSSRRLTCPYHGWTYDLEGRLRAAAHMEDDFDKSELGLAPVRCEVFEGMIFINFAAEPAPFEPVRESLGECLAPYALGSARVAHRQRYAIDANWKLSVENYTECYHCAPAHPEYSRGHGLADPAFKGKGLYRAVFEAAPECGLADRQFERIFLEAPGFGADCAYTHFPLVRGHLTGSDDGQPVAPLRGGITDYFGGCTDFQVGPVTFALAYCDYVVIYAFRPLGHQRSECDITWLVRGDAREGRDYDLERLTWLWHVTTEADKRIIEHNAAG
ncbi:MAG: aromatic ring-hydroxylating dioxygenase subunit alpha, partial [Gammaproteobacteria bacterium]